MYEKFTDKARLVIFLARYEAHKFGAKVIDREHLLLGLLRKDKALISRFLPTDVSTDVIRRQIEECMVKREGISKVEIPLSDESKAVLKYAAEESESMGHRHIGTEHLLLGLLRKEDSALLLRLFGKKESYVEKILRKNGIDLSKVRQQIEADVGRA